jgi:hypothetical protein
MTYRYAPHVDRPSKQLESLLMGKTAWADAPAAIQSWAQKSIYDAAAEILAAPDKGTRRNMLGRIPAAIRPRIEAEVQRLFALRKG